METANLIIGILGLVFGILGFIAGSWAVVNVLGFQRSTHRITQVPVETPDTVVEADMPQHILDQLPSPPEKLSATDYLKWVARQKAEEDFFEE